VRAGGALERCSLSTRRARQKPLRFGGLLNSWRTTVIVFAIYSPRMPDPGLLASVRRRSKKYQKESRAPSCSVRPPMVVADTTPTPDAPMLEFGAAKQG
jgi:hypothetical protein